MLLRVTGDRPRTTNTFQRGIAPQGKEYLGGNGSASRAAFQGFDPRVQRGKILPFNVASDDPRPMAFR